MHQWVLDVEMFRVVKDGSDLVFVEHVGTVRIAGIIGAIRRDGKVLERNWCNGGHVGWLEVNERGERGLMSLSCVDKDGGCGEE